MLDGPTWGDGVLNVLLKNKEELVRAVTENRSHNCNDPDTAEFKIPAGFRKASSPGPHERMLWLIQGRGRWEAALVGANSEGQRSSEGLAGL